MITCPSCQKQNQDHYRFCLGCGAELPRGGAADKAAAAGDSEPPEIVDEDTNVGAPVPPSAPGTSPPPAAALEDVGSPPGTCSQCGHVNPPTNRFCASCGNRIDAAPDAAAAKKKPPASDDEVAAVLIALDPEGNEVGRHSLGMGDSVIGRNLGGVFGSDSFLSPEHAIFRASGGTMSVEDLDSLNGVFRKLIAEQSEHLVSGQRFRIGQELLQYDELSDEQKDANGVVRQGTSAEGVIGTLALVVGRETARPSFPISERGINLGRERGDILFPDDGYVSGLHCHVSYDDGEMYVTDLGSSNGTFVQLHAETTLRNGDVLLMGQQLFRIAI